VNAILASPETSLGRPYSFPSVSRIYHQLHLNPKRYLDIDSLSIAFVAADSSGDHDKGIGPDEIPYTPWRDVALRLCMDLELERLRGCNEGNDESQQQRGMHGDTSSTRTGQQQENSE